jgi:hypothetical protein
MNIVPMSKISLKPLSKFRGPLLWCYFGFLTIFRTFHPL